MSLVYRRRNPSPYLHIPPPRSPLKIVAAFMAGAVFAGFLLQRPADSSKFFQPKERLTSGFSADGRLAGAVADQGETAALAGATAGTQSGEADAAANAARKRKSHAAHERVLELPDGRRIGAYRNAADGSFSPGGEYLPAGGLPAPFRLNSPMLTR